LLDLARSHAAPVCTVPGGQPPRSATGYLFIPLISFLQRSGLLRRDLSGDLADAVNRLTDMSALLGPAVPTAQNPAKQMAMALHGRLPVIYGSQGYRGAVAVRWKGQFNENAKQPAFANVLPEQNHNEILAWNLAARFGAEWSVIFLRDPSERSAGSRIARRVEVTAEIVGGSAQVIEVWAEGDSMLERMLGLFYSGDFITVYLAYLNGVCPTDIGSIDRLKAELAANTTQGAEQRHYPPTTP
ncbi:MAG TPA: SIS domain-containing protein, partial [Chthonomonadales bacterium]|nr:SIS domain-containing protein [Chthonomonadales bacterium]